MADLSQAYSEVKSLPDEVLSRELKSPTGMIPGYLILGELKERSSMRSSHMRGETPKPKSLAEEYAGSVEPFVNMPPPPPPDPNAGIGGLPPQAPPSGIGSLPAAQQPAGYAAGGIIGLAGGGKIGEIEQYIRAAAQARGINPDIAVRVARSEGGLSDPFQQGRSMLSYGREESYGPFQLHMRNGGVGVRALQAGVDPRKDWRGGVDYALNEASNKGWGQWYGAAKAGIGNRQGLGGSATAPVTANPLAMSPETAAVEAANQSISTGPGMDAMLAPAASTEGVAALEAADPVAATTNNALGTLMAMQAMPELFGGGSQGTAPAPPPPAPEPQRAPIDPYELTARFSQTPGFYERRKRGMYG